MRTIVPLFAPRHVPVRPYRHRGQYQYPHQPECHAHRKYRLTCSEYHMLEQESDGYCDICQRNVRAAGVTLQIDHDHGISGRAIRGLLCPTCNRDLIFVEDGGPSTQAEAEYLNDPWYRRVGLDRVA